MKERNELANGDGLEDSPLLWFFVLEEARQRCDFARAAEAQDELRRLGVEVPYMMTGSPVVRKAVARG